MRRLFILPRILPVLLSFSLALPNSAYALRQLNAGAEESPVKGKLSEALIQAAPPQQPNLAAAGAEESSGRGAEDRLLLTQRIHETANLLQPIVTILHIVKIYAEKNGDLSELDRSASELIPVSEEMARKAREVMTQVAVGEEHPEGLEALKLMLERFKELAPKVNVGEIEQAVPLEAAALMKKLPDSMRTVILAMEAIIGQAEGRNPPAVSTASVVEALSIEAQIRSVVDEMKLKLGESLLLGNGSQVLFEGIKGIPQGVVLPLTHEQTEAITHTLRELLKNAGKYHRPGIRLSIVVSGTYRPGQPGQPGRLEIQVVDNGIGIRLEDQSNYGKGGVLELPKEVTVAERAGIGVKAQKAVLQRLGGDLTLIPERTGPERGTGVLLWLPVTLPLPELPGTAAGAEERGLGEIFLQVADSIQGSGVVVVGPEALESRARLFEEIVQSAPTDLLKRILFYAVGGDVAGRLKQLSPAAQVIPDNDINELAVLLMSLRATDRVTVLGPQSLARQLQSLLPPTMAVTPLDPKVAFRLILNALGVPESVLNQVDTTGLEENLARARAA